jgi:endonuclease/exonuclease/phosphatase family metal-dependent hydrolase
MYPVLALDRLWVKPRTLLRNVEVHSTPLARLASDHLPLTAELDLRCGEPL